MSLVSGHCSRPQKLADEIAISETTKALTVPEKNLIAKVNRQVDTDWRELLSLCSSKTAPSLVTGQQRSLWATAHRTQLRALYAPVPLPWEFMSGAGLNISESAFYKTREPNGPSLIFFPF